MSPAENTLALDAIGRVPLPGDNAAIAIRDIEAGTRFRYEGREHRLPHTILEGHRFAVAPIKAGEYLKPATLPLACPKTPASVGPVFFSPAVVP